MRDYGSVPTRFWINPDTQELSPYTKLLAVYLLTGPHTNMLGCFRLPLGYVSEDLKLTAETVSKGLAELVQNGFIACDLNINWILIRRFLEWSPVENPNQAKSLRKLFEQTPEKSCFYNELIEILLLYNKHFDETFRSRLETLSKAFRNQKQEQDQKQDQEQKQEDSSARLLNNRLLETAAPITTTDFVSQQRGNPISTNLSPPDAVISIPLNDKTEFALSKPQIDEWQLLYPAVDVLQTLRHIRAWNLANPTRCKTRSGILRHITAWLAKEQNQGGSSPPRKTQPSLHDVNAHNLRVVEEWLSQSQNTVVEGEVVVNPLTCLKESGL